MARTRERNKRRARKKAAQIKTTTVKTSVIGSGKLQKLNPQDWSNKILCPSRKMGSRIRKTWKTDVTTVIRGSVFHRVPFREASQKVTHFPAVFFSRFTSPGG